MLEAELQPGQVTSSVHRRATWEDLRNTLTIAILRGLHAQVLGPCEEVWGRWREPTQTQGDKKAPVLGMEPVVFIAP